MAMPSQIESPLVTVVVPCYNNDHTIGECLSSLRSQNYPRSRYEVIVVDNGSNDGTCEHVIASYPWAKLIHSVEKGSGYARNDGVRQAAGELILSTDADCVVDQAWISGMVTAFAMASPNVAAIGGKILPYSTSTAVEQHQPAWIKQPDAAITSPQGRYAATPNAAFRKTTFQEVGGFDGTLGFDDIDLGVRFIEAGYAVEYTDHAIVWHRNPAGLYELFRHRIKYGRFSFTLNRKHPQVFGDPTLPGAVRRLFMATLRRVTGDLFVKLPIALMHAPAGRPRIWPLIDAVLALGNAIGFAHGANLPRTSAATIWLRRGSVEQ